MLNSDEKQRIKQLVRIQKPMLDLVGLKKYKPAELSWACVGSVSNDEALFFAACLIKASADVDEMNQNLRNEGLLLEE